MKNEKILVKKMNWNANELDNSTQIVDKELNKGLILSISNNMEFKKVSKPKGYNEYIQPLKEYGQNHILDRMLQDGKIDFYLYNILSTDKFYNNTFSVKINFETIAVIYKIKDRLFFKVYQSIFNADRVQDGFTQTLVLQDVTDVCKHSFLMIDDIELSEKLKGKSLSGLISCINNFKELKTFSCKDRQEILLKSCDTLKAVSDNDTHYISLQTQNINKLRNEAIQNK